MQEAHSIHNQKDEVWSNWTSCHKDAIKEYNPEGLKKAEY
jgi:hypothetical protein